MLASEVAKHMLNNLLVIIKGISDKEYQRRIWIREEGPEVDDFVETVCCFFDNGDPVLENYGKSGMSEVQFNLLKTFRDEFRKFADANDLPQLFIDTPEWTRITLMAKEVSRAFEK